MSDRLDGASLQRAYNPDSVVKIFLVHNPDSVVKIFLVRCGIPCRSGIGESDGRRGDQAAV
jgi:hypothetical protein